MMNRLGSGIQIQLHLQPLLAVSILVAEQDCSVTDGQYCARLGT